MKRITILLADDHRLLRDTWKQVLESDPRFQVIGEATNGDELITLAKERSPRIILMDLHMPPLNGMVVIREICHYLAESKIIGVTIYNLPAYARKILDAGAMGYITKNSSKNELMEAIFEVNEGRRYICNEMKGLLKSERVSSRHKTEVHHSTLTPREKEVTALLITGLSSREIGSRLLITERTVEMHRYNVLKKLQLQNTVSLVNYINMYGVG